MTTAFFLSDFGKLSTTPAVKLRFFSVTSYISLATAALSTPSPGSKKSSTLQPALHLNWWHSTHVHLWCAGRTRWGKRRSFWVCALQESLCSHFLLMFFLFVCFWAVWCIFYSFKNQKVSYNRISWHERHGWPKCLNTERNMFSIHLLVTVVILKINMKMGFLNTAWFHSENTQSKMVSKPNSRIVFPL